MLRVCSDNGAVAEGFQERPLAGDASARRYSRVTGPGGSSFVLVRYPPGNLHQLERDLAVAEWCESRGLRVPRRVQVLADAGVVCFEDWGDDDAEAVLRGLDPPGRKARALELAGPLGTLASLDPGSLPGWNPPLDATRLRLELAAAESWFLEGVVGRIPGPDVIRWFDWLAARVAEHPRRICHRDYHLNNLFFLPDGAVGILDIQDILVGPDTYDAASLLGDRAFPELFDPRFHDVWLESWAHRTSAPAGWELRVRQTEAQRGFKVLGTFARLSRVRSQSYAAWLPPLARRMARLGEALGAPSTLVSLLLDWAAEGGRSGRDGEFSGDG